MTSTLNRAINSQQYQQKNRFLHSLLYRWVGDDGAHYRPPQAPRRRGVDDRQPPRGGGAGARAQRARRECRREISQICPRRRAAAAGPSPSHRSTRLVVHRSRVPLRDCGDRRPADPRRPPADPTPADPLCPPPVPFVPPP
eukprot:gene19488-biopygen17505